MNLYKTACVQQLLVNLSKSFFFFLWLVTALSMLPVPHHLSTYIYSLYVRLAAIFRDDRSSCRMCSSACVAGRWRPLLQLDAEHQSYRRERRLHGRRTRRHGDLHRDEPWISVLPSSDPAPAEPAMVVVLFLLLVSICMFEFFSVYSTS